MQQSTCCSTGSRDGAGRVCATASPHAPYKPFSMNASPSSQQKGQGSPSSKEALLGSFPEVWEQQGGREAVGASRER